MRLRVMTFNVRGASLDREGPNTWERRALLNVAVIRSQAPDLIGFHECETSHLHTYQQHLSEYDRLLGSSIVPEEREIRAYNAIFWRSECLALLDSGSFWLSETPEVRSRFWNTAYPRLATWARFSCSTGHELLHLNTHLDHISKEARVRGTEVILQR
ncbi:MAG: endonuclease/exonuclease/phosphatase family protein, partial [Ktedonobacteraceae bacterium]